MPSREAQQVLAGFWKKVSEREESFSSCLGRDHCQFVKSRQKDEFPIDSQFDSSLERGKSFTFTLGSGKVIKAMDLAVATMNVNEKAQIVCRSDYGYGSEGYRTNQGDVVVPPFRTLCFEIELLSSS